MVGHIQGGGAVRRADDADGRSQPQDQAVVARRLGQHDGDQHQRNQERGEDAELGRRAEEDHAGILQQRREIDHGAYGDKDQHREQLVLDSGVEQHRQEALGTQHAGRGAARDLIDHRRQIGQNRAEADRQQQGGFIVLLDGQIDQYAGNDKHHQRFQALRREEIQHAGKKLLEQSQNIHSESSSKAQSPTGLRWCEYIIFPCSCQNRNRLFTQLSGILTFFSPILPPDDFRLFKRIPKCYNSSVKKNIPQR